MAFRHSLRPVRPIVWAGSYPLACGRGTELHWTQRPRPPPLTRAGSPTLRTQWVCRRGPHACHYAPADVTSGSPPSLREAATKVRSRQTACTPGPCLDWLLLALRLLSVTFPNREWLYWPPLFCVEAFPPLAAVHDACLVSPTLPNCMRWSVGGVENWPSYPAPLLD